MMAGICFKISQWEGREGRFRWEKNWLIIIEAGW